MKKYTLYLLAIFSFFLFTSDVFAYNFEGHYECYRGGTLLNRSNFSIEGKKDLTWRCNSGYTNVNFYFEAVNVGMGAANGDRASYSFVPSSPLGISSGADLQNLNSKCLVSQSLIVCPSTYQNGYGFTLNGDGGYYWHIMRSFDFAGEEEIAALSNYQTSLSMNESTNSAISNSTNSIINNQNSQFNDIKKQTEELKQQQEEQNETSKGIWGTIKEIFSSIVGLPVKIFNGIKSIFLPDPICFTNLLNIYSNYSPGDIVENKGIRFQFNDNGSITIDGTSTADSDLSLFGKWANTSNVLTLDKDFKVSLFGNDTNSMIFLVNDGTNELVKTSSSAIVKVNETKNVNYVMIRVPKNTTINNVTIFPQISYSVDANDFTMYDTEVCTGGNFGDWFENVVNGIGNFFSNLTSAIGNFFAQLGEKIGGFFENLISIFTDDDVDVDDTFFSDFSDENYGLTSVISAPLSLINSITSSTCSEFSAPLPFVSENLTLPCMSSIYSNYFGALYTLYQNVMFGVVSYWICIKIMFIVKGFKDPDSDKIEVMDL